MGIETTGFLRDCHLFDRTRRNIRLLDGQVSSTFLRTALCKSNRPDPFHFTDLNLLQPKPAFSSLDRVFLAPAAEFWAVRSGPPVSAALARSAGLQVSSPRASAGRYVLGWGLFDLTFFFSFTGISVVGNLSQSG